jgi:hypothetical protein
MKSDFLFVCYVSVSSAALFPILRTFVSQSLTQNNWISSNVQSIASQVPRSNAVPESSTELVTGTTDRTVKSSKSKRHFFRGGISSKSGRCGLGETGAKWATGQIGPLRITQEILVESMPKNHLR